MTKANFKLEKLFFNSSDILENTMNISEEDQLFMHKVKYFYDKGKLIRGCYFQGKIDSEVSSAGFHLASVLNKNLLQLNIANDSAEEATENLNLYKEIMLLLINLSHEEIDEIPLIQLTYSSPWGISEGELALFANLFNTQQIPIILVNIYDFGIYKKREGLLTSLFDFIHFHFDYFDEN